MRFFKAIISPSEYPPFNLISDRLDVALVGIVREWRGLAYVQERILPMVQKLIQEQTAPLGPAGVHLGGFLAEVIGAGLGISGTGVILVEKPSPGDAVLDMEIVRYSFGPERLSSLGSLICRYVSKSTTRAISTCSLLTPGMASLLSPHGAYMGNMFALERLLTLYGAAADIKRARFLLTGIKQTILAGTIVCRVADPLAVHYCLPAHRGTPPCL